MIKISRYIVALGSAIGALFLSGAAWAQDKPACPAGTEGVWAWQVKTDTIELIQRDALVDWQMTDGTSETSHGFAVNYYWSEPYEDQRERLMDGGMNLQVGLSLLRPPTRGMSYGVTAFSTVETDPRHDLDKSLSIDGASVTALYDDGWNPQSTTSIYVSGLGKYDGPTMKTAFEEGGHTFKVDVWYKNEDFAGGPEEYGSASVVVDSVRDAIAALRPVMAVEKARQAETGIWCQFTKF